MHNLLNLLFNIAPNGGFNMVAFAVYLFLAMALFAWHVEKKIENNKKGQ